MFPFPFRSRYLHGCVAEEHIKSIKRTTAGVHQLAVNNPSRPQSFSATVCAFSACPTLVDRHVSTRMKKMALPSDFTIGRFDLLSTLQGPDGMRISFPGPPDDRRILTHPESTDFLGVVIAIC